MNRRELLLTGASLAACSPATSQAQAPAFPMRRGINLGNALEAPNEGDWGYRIEAAHIDAIAQAGFDGVRLPVRWSAHAEAGRPYLINPAFLNRVAEVVDQALDRGLKVQLDLHHYSELFDLTAGESLLVIGSRLAQERFIAIWRQVAHHFRERSSALMFEPINEPNGRYWSEGRTLQIFQRRVADAVRESNPDRTLIVGPANWQNIDALRDWRPPEGENIAVSVHYYEPHAFTHHRAEWLGNDAPVFGRDWGTAADRAQVREHIGLAARWGRERGYAMQLGEFGVNGGVPIQQRAAWTRAVREACEAEGLGWCAWDFSGAFPVWDRARQTFIPLMRDALLS